MAVKYDELKKKYVARFYDDAGRDRIRTRPSRVAAEVEMIKGAGKRSRADIAQCSIEAFVQIEMEELKARGASYDALKIQHAEIYAVLVEEHLKRPVAEFTYEHAVALHDEWKRLEHKPSTIRNRQYILERVLEGAWRHGAVFRNVAREAFESRRPSVWQASARKLVPSSHVALMRKFAKSPLRRGMIELILSTRPSMAELAALRWGDLVELDGDEASVTYNFISSAGREVEHFNPHRIRTLPLGAAAPFLRAWRDDPDRPASPHVFPRANGQRLSAYGIYEHFVRIQFEAGLVRKEGYVRGRPKAKDNTKSSMFARFAPAYSMHQLGNSAVIDWYVAGIRELALAERVGCTLRGLRKFQTMFDEFELDDEGVRRAGNMLEARQ